MRLCFQIMVESSISHANSGGNSLSSSGSNGRIARGIASRRGRKKKKKSDADLSFNRFWKVNGKKAGGK